jgi:hypothetical protein
MYVCICACREKVEVEFYVHKGAQTDSGAYLASKGYVPEVGHAPPVGSDVKNEWNYTSMFSRL